MVFPPGCALAPPEKAPRWDETDSNEKDGIEMAAFNTPGGYGWISRLAHWLTVALILAVLGVAAVMEGTPRLYGLHKSLGVLVLGLGTIRIALALVQTWPRPIGLPAWLAPAVKAEKMLLLAWLVAMPLSGWAMTSAAGRALAPFGLFTLPALVAADPGLAHTLREGHELLAHLGIAVIVLHAGAALWHHFIRKDATLMRMLTGVPDQEP